MPVLYAAQSQKFLLSAPVSAYIPFASALLEVEQDRLHRLLPPETATALLHLCEAELIGRHTAALEAEFNSLLQAGDHKQLLLLYALLERNASALGALQSSLTAHLLLTGQRSIAQAGLTGLLRLTEEGLGLLSSAFNSSSQMSSAIHSALSTLLNRHLPQPSASLTDALLAALKDPAQPSNLITSTLLPLLDDFDSFYNCFQDSLAHAICFPTTNPPLPEQELASDLITRIASLPSCSPERACHLKQMLRDAVSNRDLLRWDPASPWLLSIQLLTAHSWPSGCEGRAGEELDWFPEPEALDLYTRRFLDGQEGKKLSWCPQLTSVQVQDTQTGRQYLVTPQQLQLLLNGPAGDGQEYDRIMSIINGSGRESENESDARRESNVRSDASTSTNSTSTSTSSTSTSVISLIPRNVNKSSAPLTSSSNPSTTTSQPLPTTSDHSHLLQSLLVSLLKRRSRASPTELLKLTRTAAGALKHGHSFRPADGEIEAALGVLMEKGFVEGNRRDNVYIYLA